MAPAGPGRDDTKSLPCPWARGRRFGPPPSLLPGGDSAKCSPLPLSAWLPGGGRAGQQKAPASAGLPSEPRPSPENSGRRAACSALRTGLSPAARGRPAPGDTPREGHSAWLLLLNQRVGRREVGTAKLGNFGFPYPPKGNLTGAAGVPVRVPSVCTTDSQQRVSGASGAVGIRWERPLGSEGQCPLA